MVPQRIHSVGVILRSACPTTDFSGPANAGHCTRAPLSGNKVGVLMLHYAVVFFIIALIAAFFGFGGIAVGAAGIAKVLFIVFLIGAVVTFLMSLGRRV
jgi:uncharacterized membrane protein YtjA (UPF0391 family)